MKNATFNKITIEQVIETSIEKAWNFWTNQEHILKWNHASSDWHTTKVENDLRKGGRFSSRMEAKDGSFGFDFEGYYDEIIPNKTIAYSLGDGRKVEIHFSIVHANQTKIIETFDAETLNSLEMQQQGWQAILDNFKKYTESH